MKAFSEVVARIAVPADWQVVRELCLESCQEPPFYLVANENWPIYGEADWVDHAVGPDRAMILLYDVSASPPYPIGKARISSANGDPTTAVADAIYIRAAYRGRGHSRLLWRARLDWARSHRFLRVTTIHRLSNVRSMRSILAQGFVVVERIPPEEIPGATEPEIVYELVLK